MTWGIPDSVVPSVLQPVLSACWRQLEQKQFSNQLLTAYYESDRAFKDLGISIPPQLRNTHAALGWPAKAVQALTRKHQFEGFTLQGGEDPFDMNDLFAANQFGLELIQAINSSNIHSCAFLTVSSGDVAAGDPEVVVQARSAEWATGLWDSRSRRMKAFLAVTDQDDYGTPSAFTFMVPGGVWVAVRELNEWKVMSEQFVPGGRLLAEPIVYDPQLNRPFGRSRITHEVRYLTDAAVRTLVRAETSAEFFAAPQRYALNVDADAFEGKKWTAIIGRMLALEPGEDGETPQVGQFPQISMEPHLSMYRQLAQNFCAATNLPQSSVGLFAENPASAEAMQAAEAALAEEAEYQWRVYNPSLVRLFQSALMLRDGLVEVPAESWKLQVAHRPARYVSPQAAADFTAKAVGAVPRLADTTEVLRGLQFSEAEISSIKAEWKQGQNLTVLDALMGGRNADQVGNTVRESVGETVKQSE